MRAKFRSSYSFNKRQHGFTLVELLIVIVVIAILAAITIVAYSGISQRAVIASLSSDLDSASKQLKLDQIDLSNYPAATPTASNGSPLAANVSGGGVGLKASNGTTYQYHVNNNTTPQTFCLTATNGSTSYFITSGGVPTVGACPGDGVGGVASITNLIANPSLGTDSSGWATGGYGTGGVGSIARTASIGPSGGYAMRISWATAATSGGSQMGVTTASIASGSAYTASCWVRSSQTSSSGTLRVGIGSDVYDSTAVTLTANVYQRISQTFTPTTGGVPTIAGRISNLSGTTSGLTLDVTNCMLTAGTTLYTYADGSSPNWIWNGTANASTSSGQPL